jgi:micrococcal nuclease
MSRLSVFGQCNIITTLVFLARLWRLIRCLQVEGKIVRLEQDISETDRYGRLLRYVYVGDVFVNAELVRQGLAQVSTYPPDVKYQDVFLQLQREARAAGRGLWSGACAVFPTPTAPSVIAPSNGNCDPSYPDVCIPPYPPDLDCGQIPYRRFRVVGADPHRFDGDKDGIGCESG